MTADALDRSLEHAHQAQQWVPPIDSHEVYGDLADWLGVRINELATSATESIWAELPSYHDSQLQSDVTQHIARVYGVFMTTMHQRRDPQPADFDWTPEHASRRVQAGISLVDFLKAFRIAQLTLWESVLEWTQGQPASERAALHLVGHLMRTIEAGSAAAASSYLEAQQYDLADLENVRRVLIGDLLSGSAPSRPRHLAMLREAGLSDGEPFIVAAAVLDDNASEGAQELLARSARTHLLRMTGGLCTVNDAELVVVHPAEGSGERGLRQRLSRIVEDLAGHELVLRVGLGAPRNDLADAADAHAEALLARDSLGAVGGVTSVSDLSTLDYLLRRPDDTVSRLIRPQVRAFFAEDMAGDGTYGDTLQAYIQHDLNAREAAGALHIHVNTMYYRLDRIADRTGCDLRCVSEVIELLLAARTMAPARS